MSLNTRETRQCLSNSSDGVTLIELLVSLVIVAVMFSFFAFLFNMFVQNLGKTRYSYVQRSMNYYWLNSAISSMFYYVVEDRSRFFGDEPERVFFFEGNSDSMQFITGSLLSFRGHALERLYLKDGTLYLSETPLFSPANDYASPKETEETKVIPLFTFINQIKFSYIKKVEPNVPPVEERPAPQLLKEMPDTIKLAITYTDGTGSEWHFKVQSDFVSKRTISAAKAIDF